ncbi:MAG: 16S rRNA (guanine(527)-N(7))-methyltransferase RsmG [Bryobacteraceae bacterium]
MFAETLREKLGSGAGLDRQQVSLLARHFELLKRWNKVLNLTSIRSDEEAVERHYCEAIFLAMHLPAGSLRVADVGSGGGFPGFPVGVVRPDCCVTLIESHQRKSVFLKEATRGLGNFRILAVRAEEVREEFDHVISRAVSYTDLRRSLKNLGVCADLLTGGEAPPDELGFVWEEILQLPWGEDRFLRLGERRK